MDKFRSDRGAPVINILKKHDFPLRIERLFTRAGADPFDLVELRESDAAGDEAAFEHPGHWSAEAASSFAVEAVCRSIPSGAKPAEENTVPSWLWRRQLGAGAETPSAETSVRQIFHRVAGAATYAGWKHGVFADEDEARAFYDEIRALLAQRTIALDPARLAVLGVDWAYGIETKAPDRPSVSAPASFEAGTQGKKSGPVEIRNASIDALLGGNQKIADKWQKFLAAAVKDHSLTLRFADVAGDWSATPLIPAAAALNLLAFRREDGSVDIERIAHAARLLAILLEMHKESGIPGAIGFHNLAPLLMSQGLAYDSDTGRATAAALTAIVTAEACGASAQLAALLGPSLDFAANREVIMRTLRNHRRAAYGDRNDYEKISVLPASLMLDPGADIALIAAARYYWDEALELVRQYGLRSTQFSELDLPPSLSHFMESASTGIAALPSLTIMRAIEPDLYRREIHPVITEALFKLDYDTDARAAIIAHIAGHGTLANAPLINHASLRKKGFGDHELEEMENYLAYASDIRLAFTPWILGEKFYHDVLKIPAGKSRDVKFDLLRALGFSAADIDAANAFCYGYGTARGTKALQPAHAAVLAQASEISPEAHIRMGAAVQSFVSGDAGLALPLDAKTSEKEIGKLLLAAWRQGVKSVALAFTAKEPARSEKRPSTAASMPAFTAPLRSTLRGKPKAQGKLVSLKRGRSDKPDRPIKN